jgi:hypothetical protein
VGAAGVAWLLAAQSTARWRALIATALSLAPLAALPQLAWNAASTGDPLSLRVYIAAHTGSGVVFGSGLGAFARGVAGLVASPARGLLFFAPILPFALYVGFRYGDRQARILGTGILAHFALIAAYRQWWGGWALGPRMLAEAVWLCPLLVLAMPPSRVLRNVLLGVSTMTVLVGVLGTFRYQIGAWELRRDPDAHHEALWDGWDSPIVAMIRGRAIPTLDAPPGPYAYCTRRALDRVTRVSP